MKFEFEYTGYMNFESEEEARNFGYKMEEILGFLTRNDLKLYLTNCEEIPESKIYRKEGAKMKVYILWGDEQIAPNKIRGIYATRELAEKHRGTGWCAITEYEVQE